MNLLHPLPWILIGVILSASQAIHVDFSPDSMHYVDIARNLSSGYGLSSFHLNLNSSSVPDRVLFWPPLYPILLAIGMKMGLNMLWAVRLVLVLSFVISSVCLYLIGRMWSSSDFGIICLVAWLGMAPSLYILTYAWSELPFMALSSAFVVIFVYAVRNSFSISKMFFSGVIAGLAAMCRYVGLISIIAAVASLAYLVFATRSSRRTLRFLLYASCLFVGFTIVSFPWFLHNLISTGTITGFSRPPSTSGTIENTARLFKSLGEDLIIPLVIMLTFLGLSRLNIRNLSSLRNVWSPKIKPVAVISCIWVLFYSASLIVLSSIYWFSPIDSRLTSPIYIVFIPLILHTGYQAYVFQHGQGLVISKVVLGIAFGLILAGSLLNSAIDYRRVMREKKSVPSIEHWIEETTPRTSLFIGKAIWWIRFKSGRAVLESGYPSMPELTPEGVSKFLQRFGRNFSRTYLFFSEPVLEDSRLVQEYNRLGYSLMHQDVGGNQRVYEILRDR